jgi:hypothetical protein
MKKMIVMCALALAACGKASGANGGGELDDRAMMKLQQQVLGGKFDDAVKATEAMLGPARAKDATDWQYAVVQGDKCFQFGLMKKDDGTVGGVQNGTFDKHDKSDASFFADCEKMAKLPPAK